MRDQPTSDVRDDVIWHWALFTKQYNFCVLNEHYQESDAVNFFGGEPVGKIFAGTKMSTLVAAILDNENTDFNFLAHWHDVFKGEEIPPGFNQFTAEKGFDTVVVTILNPVAGEE